MANTFAVSRAHLIYIVCLPLAVLVGYFLASPLDSDSLAVVVLVFSVLSVPLFMRWHYPMLFLTWNAPVFLYFLPGTPSLSCLIVGISLFFTLLNRSLGRTYNFFEARSVARALVFLALVVLATAIFTGGIGMRSLGSSSYGGRKYFFLLCGIFGYFALASQRVRRAQANLYVGLFFLSGLLVFIGYASGFMGPGFDAVSQVFASYDVTDQMEGNVDTINGDLVRYGSLNFANTAIFSFLLMRYGISGLFEIRRPWRMALFVLSLIGSLLGGFRSVLGLFITTAAMQFYWEGLIRTKFLPLIAVMCALGAGLLLPFAQKLPLSAQRTLSFLPIQIDPAAKRSATASSEWRFEMWDRLLPQVPKYLLKGKGYALSPDELFMSQLDEMRGFEEQSASAMVSGDYHNGLLSIIIPFGLAGMIAFVWFLMAAYTLLRDNWLYGDAALKSANTFILAFFCAKVIFFVFVFGSISSDLLGFTGLAGISIALNGVASKGGGLPNPEQDSEFAPEM